MGLLAPNNRNFLLSLLIFSLLPRNFESKRGGGGYSRGGSSSRSGGIFGKSGGHNSGSYRGGSVPHSNKGSSSGNYFGSQSGKWNSQSAHRTSTFSKGNGIGSVLRSNSFKNAIVGAAAGYLTYQAGKAIINNVMRPMMWNNRPYYWGSDYYRPVSGQSMCRMPINNGDSHFGNVYLPDNTRPREIVWSCGYYETCCGYECCPASSGGGGYYSGPGHYGQFGLGSIIVLLLLCCCGGFIIHQICKARRDNNSGSWFNAGDRGWFGGGNKYARPSDPPPQYAA